MTPQPVNNSDLAQALRLSLIPGVGPRIRSLLINRFGSPSEIFQADEQELLAISGVGPKVARAIRDPQWTLKAEEELARCENLGVELLMCGDSLYPHMLSEIHDPPEPLYCRGKLTEADRLAVAIVGSRRCSLYGRQQAERIATGLVNAGITVISGLARGIDAAAHHGALKAGGRTIAVMATGLSRIYPPEHVDLANEVRHSGCLVTECSLDQPPLPGLFPQRNRIISGLSLGVVIVEATRKSGALHTARHALEQGREVFAVPGRLDSFSSEGCHDLIRDGVTLIRGVDDILEELGPLTSPVKRSPEEEVHIPRELNLNDQERTVLNLLDLEPKHLDDILRHSELENSRTLATLTVLEMKRLAKRLPGGYLVRSTH
ncbi:MAG: DNA-processing protein DprA [Planctomycetaceae bacterium]